MSWQCHKRSQISYPRGPQMWFPPKSPSRKQIRRPTHRFPFSGLEMGFRNLYENIILGGCWCVVRFENHQFQSFLLRQSQIRGGQALPSPKMPTLQCLTPSQDAHSLRGTLRRKRWTTWRGTCSHASPSRTGSDEDGQCPMEGRAPCAMVGTTPLKSHSVSVGLEGPAWERTLATALALRWGCCFEASEESE